MKKCILLLLLSVMIGQKLLAQTKVSPLEQKLADSLCYAVGKLDFSKITTREEAIAAYTSCVGNYYELLGQLAEEKHMDVTNTDDMKKVGIQLVQDLMAMKCESFIRLEGLIAKTSVNNESSTTGTYKRIDTKGFNYIVLTGENNAENSFLWLTQFPGSENFMNGATKYAGKKMKITWREIEA